MFSLRDMVCVGLLIMMWVCICVMASANPMVFEGEDPEAVPESIVQFEQEDPDIVPECYGFEEDPEIVPETEGDPEGDSTEVVPEIV